MGDAGDSRRDGTKGELLFVLCAVLVFIVAYRLRETGVYDIPPPPSRISSQAMLDLINETAAIPDRTERLRRIDAVIAEYDGDKTPHIDYGVTRLLVQRASDENTDAGKMAAYDAVLRRHSTREGLPARTITLLDWVAARKAASTGDTETLKKVAADNANSSRPDQRYVRMLALNELGHAASDAGLKGHYFELALAEYREDDSDENVLSQATYALNGAARALAERAETLSGDAEKLAAWNRFLEFARRNPDTLHSSSRNVSSLNKALREKIRLENAPDAAERFFSEWIAGADSDDELFNALRAKLSYRGGMEFAREAHREIIAEFAGTRDAEHARLVVRALDTRSAWPFAGASGEDIRLYGSIIDRFSGAEDEAGLGAYMSALLGKAKATDDAAEKAALCDRILAAPVPPGTTSLEPLRESAAELKSGALFAPEILTRYYAERAAKASSASTTARLLVSQARAEPSRAKKEALFNQVIAKYREDPQLEMTVMQVFHDRAYLAGDREEARRRFREAVEYVAGLKKKRNWVSWLFPEAYEKLVELAPGRTEKIALHDEQIQFYRKHGMSSNAARVMMKKAALFDAPEKIALYDGIVEMLSGGDEENAPGLVDALLAKAETVEDDEEKSALYDKVIGIVNALSEGNRYLGWRLPKAVAGRAELPGGAQFVEEYLDGILGRGTDLPGNAKLAADALEKIGDDALRDAGYEKILRRYSGESSPEMAGALDSVRVSRAFASGDHDEAMRLLAEQSGDNEEEKTRSLEMMNKRLEALAKEREAEKNALDRRLADEPAEAGKLALLEESIDRAAALRESGEAVRLLFLKADIAADAEAKARTYEEILDRSVGWRMNSYPRLWREAEKAAEARAALIHEPAERAEYYDSLLEQYGGAGSEADDFLAALRRGRALTDASP